MEQLPKLLNELQDGNKGKRCTAYKKLKLLAQSSSTHFSSDDSFQAIRCCLRGFEDSSERCREEAVEITSILIDSHDASILDWVLPSVVTRIGVSPVAEESEEIRLLLLQLASKCMSAFPHDIGPRNYIDYFQVLLENCFRDPYPDLKKEACRVTTQLCVIEPQQVRSIAVPLAKAVKASCLLHKHGAVRAEAARTLAVLFQHGASEVLGEAKDEPENRTTAAQTFILCNDHSETVRLAALTILSAALLDVKERLEYHGRFLPHLLLLSTDSFATVRAAAQQVLDNVGKLYLLDNEDNRIDLSTRRVTMKDIEWYGDDDYPDMSLTPVEAGRYPILRQRPPLGTRYAVAEATRQFLGKLLTDVASIDWVIPFSANNRKTVALRILWNTVFHCEKSSVQYAERILGALYKALRDDDAGVREEATLCVQIMGKFLTPQQYMPFLVARKATAGDEEEVTLVEKSRQKTVTVTSVEGVKEQMPTLFSTAALTTRCSILLAFGYLIPGSAELLTTSDATQIVLALTADELIESDSEELQLALLSMLGSVYEVLSQRRFIASPAQPLPPEVVQDPKQRTLDSIILYALVRLKSVESPQVQQAAASSIAQLSNLVTGSTEGIYSLHVRRLLTRYGAKLPVGAFADLVLKAPPDETLGPQLKGIFIARLGDVDFSVRVADELRYFSVLERLLWSQTTIFSTDDLKDLLRAVILPLATFRPGNPAHLLRKVAVNCLCAVTGNPYRAQLSDALRQEECSLSSKVVSLWCSASDSDDGEMRLVSMSALTDVCSLPMTAGSASEVVQSILLRFDDSNDLIRLRTSSGLLATLGHQSEVSPGFLQEVNAQMVPLVKKLLIYLDDDEERVGLRAVLVECLKLLGSLSPNIVIDLTKSAAEKHHDPTLGTSVIDHIAQAH